MNTSKPADTIPIPIPFAIPILNPSGPTTIYLPRAQFQTVMRVIVVICTFFLFRPRLVALWRTMTGTQIDSNPELRQRLEFWERERQKAAGQGQVHKGKKAVGVVDGNAGVKVEQGRKPNLEGEGTTGSASTGTPVIAKRRKA